VLAFTGVNVLPCRGDFIELWSVVPSQAVPLKDRGDFGVLDYIYRDEGEYAKEPEARGH
jgi:hypothetical protein